MAVYRITDKSWPDRGKIVVRSFLTLFLVSIAATLPLMFSSTYYPSWVRTAGATLIIALASIAMLGGFLFPFFFRRSFFADLEWEMRQDKIIQRRKDEDEEDACEILFSTKGTMTEDRRGLLINDGSKSIFIPPGVEQYSELRENLLQHFPFAASEAGRSTPIQKIAWRLLSTVFFVIGWYLAFKSSNPSIVVPLCVLLVLFSGTDLYQLWSKRAPVAARPRLKFTIALTMGMIGTVTLAALLIFRVLRD
jgi:hypothetical protein